MTADSVDRTQFLSLRQLRAAAVSFQGERALVGVAEVPPQGGTGALHDERAHDLRDAHVLRNADTLVAKNGLHSCSACSVALF